VHPQDRLPFVRTRRPGPTDPRQAVNRRFRIIPTDGGLKWLLEPGADGFGPTGEVEACPSPWCDITEMKNCASGRLQSG